MKRCVVACKYTALVGRVVKTWDEGRALAVKDWRGQIHIRTANEVRQVKGELSLTK